VPILIGIAAVIAIAVGAMLMKSKGSAPTATVQTAAARTTTAPRSATTSGATTTAPVSAVPTTSLSSTQPAIDTAKVDDEVRTRLEAERAKLAQQQRLPATAAPTL